MTQIDFYTNVIDKLTTACRIAAKAYSVGRRTLVFCPDAEVATRIDRMLWTTPATGFIPHCASASPLASVTPIIIDHSDSGAEPACDQVLLNLRPEWPPFFGRFERLIEIVSMDDEDRQRARERFKFYRDRGYEIRTHDLNETAQA
ncbi:MAG TPA: DNA polymerase III subunit chi [Burkholderiales bacterium]|nr:DNA polymerase III subunit chi [Burkholderiales bacterium]